MVYIHPDKWSPTLRLEETALKVVKSRNNSYVIAGPGAGKTELLAQRASYLLQTNICPFPKKILAISFKKDAAKNLEERVERRCGKELSRRFESKTYDAFAKKLVDQFLMAIPQDYRPTKDYEILSLDQSQLSEILNQLRLPDYLSNRYNLYSINRREFISNHALVTLPFSQNNKITLVEWATINVWFYLLHGFADRRSRLTFPIISRLAEYMLRSNPLILSALRATYSHVFLDEFQDTTAIQYALLKTCFKDSEVILTAVGDDKQRIMGWAGALPNAFETFQRDFFSESFTLHMNYRSAPNLVRMQKILSQSITDHHFEPVPSEKWKTEEGICKIWTFENNSVEAEYITDSIQQWILDESVKCRDICILVKQRVNAYAPLLIDTLRSKGIKARIESEIQDLLVEPCIIVIVDFLSLAIYGQAPEAWQRLVQVLLDFKGYAGDSEDINEVHKTENELNKYINQWRQRIDSLPSDFKKEDLADLIWQMIHGLGIELFQKLSPEYRRKNYLDSCIEKFITILWDSFKDANNWVEALNDFKGEDTIPIMTTHKSKGLEYHTVIFIGLEDEAFWNFFNQPQEDTSTFFVAFSRAKERVIFTYCDKRRRNQSRSNIDSLYNLLKEAGVEEERIVTLLV